MDGIYANEITASVRQAIEREDLQDPSVRAIFALAEALDRRLTRIEKGLNKTIKTL